MPSDHPRGRGLTTPEVLQPPALIGLPPTSELIETPDYLLPTNACLTEPHIPNHIEPSKIWKVDLDLSTPLAGMVKNIMAETELERPLSTVCSTFKISCLNAYQLTAIKKFEGTSWIKNCNLKKVIYYFFSYLGTTRQSGCCRFAWKTRRDSECWYLKLNSVTEISQCFGQNCLLTNI